MSCKNFRNIQKITYKDIVFSLAYPIVIIQSYLSAKKLNEKYLCMDYPRLNNNNTANMYCTPRVDNTLDYLQYATKSIKIYLDGRYY